jgi:hypothetical protein
MLSQVFPVPTASASTPPLKGLFSKSIKALIHAGCQKKRTVDRGIPGDLGLSGLLICKGTHAA